MGILNVYSSRCEALSSRNCSHISYVTSDTYANPVPNCVQILVVGNPPVLCATVLFCCSTVLQSVVTGKVKKIRYCRVVASLMVRSKWYCYK